MKVAHLCSVHTAYDIRIFWRHCRSLAQAGHEVVFIVPHARDEEREGVRIRAIKPPKSRLDRFARVRRQVYQAAIDEDADIYHIHSPELLPYGLRLKKHGYRVVYDAHEDLPEQNKIREWVPGPLRGIVGAYSERVEVRGAWAMDAVCVAHPTIAHRFPKDRTIVLNNYPMLDLFPRPSEWPAYAERPNRVFHVGGSCDRIRGMPQMVEAMALLPDGLDAELTVVGGIPADLRPELEAKPGWVRVDHRGPLPFEQMVPVMLGARVAILPFLPTAHHLTSFPNKLFEFMAAGLPIVATDMPHWRALLDAEDCVRWMDPEQPETMADAIADLLTHPDQAEDMGKRGRRAVEERLSWDVESRKLTALYERLCQTPVQP